MLQFLLWVDIVILVNHAVLFTRSKKTRCSEEKGLISMLIRFWASLRYYMSSKLEVQVPPLDLITLDHNEFINWPSSYFDFFNVSCALINNPVIYKNINLKNKKLMLSMSSFWAWFITLAKLITSCALLQAILGGTIQVPTLSGDVVVKVC